MIHTIYGYYKVLKAAYIYRPSRICLNDFPYSFVITIDVKCEGPIPFLVIYISELHCESVKKTVQFIH